MTVLASLSPPIGHIEHLDLNEKVYKQLRRAILSGSLPAGTRLSLTALAEQLGVSRSPIHQALTRLAAERFITVQSRRGYEVTPATRDGVTEEYDVRLALELFAAERTVGRLTPRQAQAFTITLRRTLAPLEAGGAIDLPGFIEANDAFHGLQLDFAANPTMASVYRNLRVTLLMERLLAGLRLDRERVMKMAEQHVTLHGAFLSGDLPAAQRAIREHVGFGRDLAVEAIELAGGAR